MAICDFSGKEKTAGLILPYHTIFIKNTNIIFFEYLNGLHLNILLYHIV